MTSPKDLTGIVDDLARKIATANERRKRDAGGREEAGLKVIAAVQAAFNVHSEIFYVELTQDPTWITIYVVTQKGRVPVVDIQAAEGELHLQLRYSGSDWQKINLDYDPTVREFVNGKNVVAGEVGNAIAAWMRIPGSLG